MRKIYVVAKGTRIEKAIVEAKALGIGEIALGIPPKLSQVLKESDLPTVYEEPSIEPLPDRFAVLQRQIDNLNNKVETLEGIKSKEVIE